MWGLARAELGAHFLQLRAAMRFLLLVTKKVFLAFLPSPGVGAALGGERLSGAPDGWKREYCWGVEGGGRQVEVRLDKDSLARQH